MGFGSPQVSTSIPVRRCGTNPRSGDAPHYTNHATLMRYNSCTRNNIRGMSTHVANLSWISVHMRLLRTLNTSVIRGLSKMGRKMLHFPSPKRTTMEAAMITMMCQVRKTWKKSTRKPMMLLWNEVLLAESIRGQVNCAPASVRHESLARVSGEARCLMNAPPILCRCTRVGMRLALDC